MVVTSLQIEAYNDAMFYSVIVCFNLSDLILHKLWQIWIIRCSIVVKGLFDHIIKIRSRALCPLRWNERRCGGGGWRIDASQGALWAGLPDWARYGIPSCSTACQIGPGNRGPIWQPCPMSKPVNQLDHSWIGRFCLLPAMCKRKDMAHHT